MKLKAPYTMVVSGQTESGKTYFVDRLIRNQEIMHEKPFEKIIYAYSVFQPLYHALISDVPGLELVEGFPDEIVSGENRESGEVPSTLLVLDDMLLDLENDKRLAMLFTKFRHHKVSTIFILQNLYHGGKYIRTVTRNAQYMVIFPNPRDMNMISTLGRQIFPEHKNYLADAFSKATAKKYGYLFLDLKPDTDKKFRVREGIFPNEQEYVYLPK